MKRTRMIFGFVILALGVSGPAMAEGFSLGSTAARSALALSEFVGSAISLARPESTSLILVGIGGLLLLGAMRRRRIA